MKKHWRFSQAGFLRMLGALGCVAVVLAGSPARAEEGKPGRPPRGGPGPEGMDPLARLRMLTEKLNLSPEQQSKIKEIFLREGPAMKELLSKGRENLTAEDKAKLREMMKAQREEMETILTAEQLAKAKELRAQRPGGPGGPEGGARGEKGKKSGTE
jgi:Spy/CpxP family protein refolding chaperone